MVNSNSKPGCISDNIQNTTNLRSDLKFNLIVHGIPESNPGTLWLARIQSDFNSIDSLLSDLKSGIPESSIRDCIRLGKYKKDSQYLRPILAMLNRPTDVLKLTFPYNFTTKRCYLQTWPFTSRTQNQSYTPKREMEHNPKWGRPKIY